MNREWPILAAVIFIIEIQTKGVIDGVVLYPPALRWAQGTTGGKKEKWLTRFKPQHARARLCQGWLNQVMNRRRCFSYEKTGQL